MALYIVLRHRDDVQKWQNDWSPDAACIDWITTDAAVARCCKRAQELDEFVYIHRCRFGALEPRITCKVKVASVQKVGRNFFLVYFNSPVPLAGIPAVHPCLGQNSYFAVAAD